ncbi:uncharacterized protein LOC109858362 [Pseudomyrmex gracilis]|uniref:uncharacterized protein LOC109858362 n=1 Tax=Pseudomyrmex gracilis TaxID=219809 RepID=UPI0009952BA8|nr:uncharacterized protein LOC109858362 [Pseudomyrmex gracilis]
MHKQIDYKFRQITPIICKADKHKICITKMSEDVPFRRMKFPYTFTAKFAQFPHAYYTKHSWLFRYWHIGILLTIPIFYKIQKLSYSPENVKKWAKTREEMFSGTGHH